MRHPIVRTTSRTALEAVVRANVPTQLRAAIRYWPDAIKVALAPSCPVDASVSFAHSWVTQASPLRRVATMYDDAQQRAKEANVARAAAIHDGLILPPGAVYSWHRQMGPPVGFRGFQVGPELHGEQLASGSGGGVCQVANLLFTLAMRAGLTLRERHRHSLDLFPDDDRRVPFGCGATVFYPHKDLRFANPWPHPVQFRTWISGGELRGDVRAPIAVSIQYTIEERHARLYESNGQWMRENMLVRCWRDANGARQEELLVNNRARVMYEVSTAMREAASAHAP